MNQTPNQDDGKTEPEALEAYDGSQQLIASHGLARKIAEMIAPAVEDMGFELVRVQVTGQEGCTVQVMAERPDGSMPVEGCQMISRAVSALMDVEDPISGEYNLEVSSPGIARPLTRLKDFSRWAGHDTKIELSEMLAGRKRYRGILHGVEEGEVLLSMPIEGHDEPQIIGLSLELLAEARLVITDQLVDESLKKRSRQNP